MVVCFSMQFIHATIYMQMQCMCPYNTHVLIRIPKLENIHEQLISPISTISGRQKNSRLKISQVSPYIVYTYTLECVQEYSRQNNS